MQGADDDVVPEDVAHGGIEGDGTEGGSDGPVELELVGEGGAGEGIVAGGDVAVGDQFELVVEGEVLGDLVVAVSVELAHLADAGAVVDIGAEADFDAGAEPSADVVEDVPRLEDVGALEISVDNNVLGGALPDQLDVVDEEALAVRDTGS